MNADGATALTFMLLAVFGPASRSQAVVPHEAAVSHEPAQVGELTGTVKRVDRPARTVQIVSDARAARTTLVEVTDSTRLHGPNGALRLDSLGVGDSVRVVLGQPTGSRGARSIELISRRRE